MSKLKEPTEEQLKILEEKLNDSSLNEEYRQRYQIVKALHGGKSVKQVSEEMGINYSFVLDAQNKFNFNGFKSFEKPGKDNLDKPLTLS